MPAAPDRRLYESAEVPSVLSLSPEKIDWLVKTGQLNPIRIAGEIRFDSRELDSLIETYKQIAKRKQYVQ